MTYVVTGVMVMFHMDCFTCDACNKPFVRGQELALVGDSIYCTSDYHQLLTSLASDITVTSSQCRDEEDSRSFVSCNSLQPTAHARRARKRTNRSQTTTNDPHTLGTRVSHITSHLTSLHHNSSQLTDPCNSTLFSVFLTCSLLRVWSTEQTKITSRE